MDKLGFCITLHYGSMKRKNMKKEPISITPLSDFTYVGDRKERWEIEHYADGTSHIAYAWYTIKSH